ncbi:MAG: hypothetical protein H0W24_11630 [Lysobacter sp.]|nr:hypothetical protein [Lysobacter sp.]MDQ3269228.1 hypothetical protein [Pseudomonadota bacterium]
MHSWLAGGRSDCYRAPTAVESMALSAAFARGLRGGDVFGWMDLGHESTVWDAQHAVREASPRARGWGSYVFRSGDARALVVQAPHADSDRRTGDIALALYRATHARALALNSAHRALDGADQANAPGSPFALLGREAARPDVDALVVQVHGYGASTARRYGLAATDVVVSNATRVPDPALQLLAACLRGAGFDARLFPTEAPYPGGTRNAVRAAMEGVGGRFVHLELGADVRDELLQDPTRLDAFGACL